MLIIDLLLIVRGLTKTDKTNRLTTLVKNELQQAFFQMVQDVQLEI